MLLKNALLGLLTIILTTSLTTKAHGLSAACFMTLPKAKLQVRLQKFNGAFGEPTIRLFSHAMLRGKIQYIPINVFSDLRELSHKDGSKTLSLEVYQEQLSMSASVYGSNSTQGTVEEVARSRLHVAPGDDRSKMIKTFYRTEVGTTLLVSCITNPSRGD